MNFKKNILTVILIFSLHYAYLQTPISQSPLSRDQFFSSMASAAGSQDSEVPVSFFNYQNKGSIIDLRDIKSKFPLLKMDDYVEVSLPNMKSYSEVYNMMGVVNPKSKEPVLLIWVLGNPNAEEVSFYVDVDNDRDYLNEDGPITVLREADPIKIKIFPFGNKTRSVDMNISLPKRDKTEVEKLIKVLKNYSKRKIDNNFVIGFNVGVGVASLDHKYVINATDYPGWYETKLNEKNISLTAEKYFRYFVIGGRCTFQHIYQFASYFNEQVREFDRTGLHINTTNNRDTHSSTRLKTGLLAGIRIHLGEYFEIIPSVSGGYVNYLNGEYVSNKFRDPAVVFEHKKDKYYDIAINMEFTSKDENSFVFGLSYTNTDWAPVGFFESIDGRNLVDSHHTYAFSAGYKFGL